RRGAAGVATGSARGALARAGPLGRALLRRRLFRARALRGRLARRHVTCLPSPERRSLPEPPPPERPGCRRLVSAPSCPPPFPPPCGRGTAASARTRRACDPPCSP